MAEVDSVALRRHRQPPQCDHESRGRAASASRSYRKQDWNQAQGTVDARFVELAFPVSGVAGPPGTNPVAPEAFQLVE